MTQALVYTGHVTSKRTGKPIAGATVTVRRQIVAPYEHRIVAEPKYTTDVAGRYTFTIPPEQVAQHFLYIELDVSHPDYATRKGFGYALGMIRKNEKLGGRPFFEHVDLYPADPVRGAVVTPEGKPAAGIKVLGFSMPDRRSFDSASFSDTVTDQQGAFRLSLAKGGQAIFWLLPEDYAPSAYMVDENRGDMGRLVLEKGIVLKGRVLDEHDRPVVGVWINAEITGGPAKKLKRTCDELPVADALARSALTGAKGEFTLMPLPAGECLVQVAEYPSDYLLSRPTRRPLLGVFGPKTLSLKAGGAVKSVEVRAVPQVVIEGQFYDSRGKPRLGHEPMLWGRIDSGSSWTKAIARLWGRRDRKGRGDQGSLYSTHGTMDTSGHFIIRAPKGLKEVKLSFGTNEHGALRVRMAKDEPLSNQRRDIDLSTLERDIQGIEVVRYDAPILLVKSVADDGSLLREVKVHVEYTEHRDIWNRQGRFAQGKNVHFEKQDDGRLRSYQLLPDEEFTLTVEAEGYEPRSETLELPEGAVKELEVRLKKMP